MLASVVWLAPAALLSAPAEMPGLGPVAAVTALGVMGTGVAFAIFYELISTVGPARTLIVTYLAPAFAVVYGTTLLDEEITVATIAGLLLILAGSWLAAEGRLIQRGAAGKPPRGSDPLPARSAAGPAP
jgi:drug/metabolite transporter (DMT)-like permease